MYVINKFIVEFVFISVFVFEIYLFCIRFNLVLFISRATCPARLYSIYDAEYLYIFYFTHMSLFYFFIMTFKWEFGFNFRLFLLL